MSSNQNEKLDGLLGGEIDIIVHVLMIKMAPEEIAKRALSILCEMFINMVKCHKSIMPPEEFEALADITALTTFLLDRAANDSKEDHDRLKKIHEAVATTRAARESAEVPNSKKH